MFFERCFRLFDSISSWAGAKNELTLTHGLYAVNGGKIFAFIVANHGIFFFDGFENFTVFGRWRIVMMLFFQEGRTPLAKMRLPICLLACQEWVAAWSLMAAPLRLQILPNTVLFYKDPVLRQ